MAAYFKEQRIAYTENIMRDVITKFIFLNQIFLIFFIQANIF